MDRYAARKDCDYVVELETSSEAECLALLGDDWQKRAEFPFLDAAATPTLHRTLYVPHLHERSAAYLSYSLYERVRS